MTKPPQNSPDNNLQPAQHDAHAEHQLLQLKRLSQCFLGLGADPRENIQRLAELSAELADATELSEIISAAIRLEASRARAVDELERSETQARDVAAQAGDHAASDAQRTKLERHLAQRQKLESIGLLAAGVAHELNNPLCALVGYSQMLLDGDLPEAVRERLEKVHRQGKRCQTIVDGLLLYARQQPSRRETTNLQQVVEATLVGQFRWGPANVPVQFRPPMMPVRAVVDRQLIEQALLNLVNNAVEASQPKQAVVIAIEQLPEGRAEIRVSDQGAGMSQDIQKQMFEPFFTTKPVGEGTGLGLAIVHGIVEQHNGRISVESAKGRGTTIRLTLPAVDDVTDEMQMFSVFE